MKNKHPHAAVVLVLGLAMAGLHLADLLLWSDAETGFATAGSVWLRYIPWLAALALPYLPARRAAALAKWASEQNVGLSDVTWISEDANGAVRLVVRYGCDGAPISGDTSALLFAAEGYAISGDAYAQLGDAPAFAQQGGEAPTLPDDSAIAVVQKKTVDGEALTKSTDLLRVRRRHEAGEALTLTYERNGKRYTVDVILRESTS